VPSTRSFILTLNCVPCWSNRSVGHTAIHQEEHWTLSTIHVASALAIERTRWSYVSLLLLAGVCAAMQVGKVPPALSAIQRELHLGLVTAAWVLSMFSAIGALVGCVAGSLADRFGARRVTVFGLLCMAAASFGGSWSDAAAVLLVSRAIEGMAFVLMVVAVPSLLSASAEPRHKRFVPALWGAYMPMGMAIALASSPTVIVNLGWRPLWQLNAVLLALPAILLAMQRPPHIESRHTPALTLAAIRRALTDRDAVLLAAMFGGYTVQYLSVLGFLPTILQEQGATAQRAGTLTALAVLANAPGNFVASWLLGRGVAAWKLMAIGALVMGIAALGIFSPLLSPSTRYALVIALSAVGGLIPASIFGTIPAVARQANTGAMTMGLVVQASHVGQMIGPPLVAALAAYSGAWSASPVVLVPAACVVLGAALLLRRSS
jgi:cyanate permease